MNYSEALPRVQQVLGYLSNAIQIEDHRYKVARWNIGIFGSMFAGTVILETVLAAMMLSLLQVEILGHVVTGAIFALLVPIVIAAAHIKLHHEGEWFIRFWLQRLSSLGILLFVVGMSLMVGYSSWQAAQDAASEYSQGPTGTIGGQSIAGAPDTSSGIADLIAPIPNAFLFLGLSFAMIISVYFASFCLGKVIDALALITEGPRTNERVRELIDRANDVIARLRLLQQQVKTEQRKLPFDKKHKFAREASQACRAVIEKKLTVAKRKFATTGPDPLSTIGTDTEAETIPVFISTQDEFARHMADQMDAVRVPYLLSVLTGVSPEGENNDVV